MPKDRMSRKTNKSGAVSNRSGPLEVVPRQPPLRITWKPRLADTHPEIARQWHPSRNGALTPRDVTPHSQYRVWWLCDSGHEWLRLVHRRTENGSGCPECESESSSLAALYPKLTKEWSTKNGALTPNKVPPSAQIIVWWTCPVKDHDDYQRMVCYRTSKKWLWGCQICDGTRPEKSASFAALYPDLVREWHPELNGELDPFHLTPGSSTPVWWRCMQNDEHEWPAPINNRIRRNPECPYCRLWYVTDENRLSVQCPEVAAEWHPKRNRFLWPEIEGSFKAVLNLRMPQHLKELNRRLQPTDVAINSNEVCWWMCKAKGHAWQETVKARAMWKRICPDCKKDKLEKKDSLAALCPAVAKLWHPTRNLPLLATDLVPGSNQIVFWRCPKSATHVWKAPVCRIVQRWKNGTNGCKWCAGRSIDEKNCLQHVFPAVAKLWHPTKNDNLQPSQVAPKGNKKVWWHCGKSGHEFESKISTMAAAFEHGTNLCRFCDGRAVAPDNCLKTMYPEVAKFWHPKQNGKLTPTDVTPGSFKIVIWLCEQKHKWPAPVSNMVKSFRLGSTTKGCPFCYGKSVTAENNLWAKFPEAVKLWDAERNLPTQPWEVTPRSHKVFYWRCLHEKHHSWQDQPNQIVSALLAGRMPCPECRTCGLQFSRPI